MIGGDEEAPPPLIKTGPVQSGRFLTYEVRVWMQRVPPPLRWHRWQQHPWQHHQYARVIQVISFNAARRCRRSRRERHGRTRSDSAQHVARSSDVGGAVAGVQGGQMSFTDESNIKTTDRWCEQQCSACGCLAVCWERRSPGALPLRKYLTGSTWERAPELWPDLKNAPIPHPSWEFRQRQKLGPEPRGPLQSYLPVSWQVRSDHHSRRLLLLQPFMVND